MEKKKNIKSFVGVVVSTKNKKTINKINQFNKIYASNISLFDKPILLYKKNINNKGFYELCQLKLNASIINLDDNKISKKNIRNFGPSLLHNIFCEFEFEFQFLRNKYILIFFK